MHLAPLASTATHNLPIRQAGAGAGIYNTTRQVGSVLGSAAIGALISSLMAAQGLGEVQAGEGGGAAMGTALPEQIAEKFSTALSQSMLLPASVLIIGIVRRRCSSATPRRSGRRRPALRPIAQRPPAEPGLH